MPVTSSTLHKGKRLRMLTFNLNTAGILAMAVTALAASVQLSAWNSDGYQALADPRWSPIAP